MRDNLKDPANLDFLDGYLFRLIHEIARNGTDETGLDTYYAVRIDKRIGGLIEYEADLIRYLEKELPGRRVLHAGIGIGTLASAFAARGGSIVGIDRWSKRSQLSQVVREAMIERFPEIEERYTVVHGLYPEAGAPYVGKETVLLFTNVAQPWEDELIERVIASLPQYGDVVLCLRTLGKVLDTEPERQALFDRIAAKASKARYLPDLCTDLYVAHFTF